MKFIQSRGGKCVTLVALAMLVATSKIALADTTTLICHMNDPMGFYVEFGPSTIELNKAQSTVTVHFSATRFSSSGNPNPAFTPANLLGPLQATFSADTITFKDQWGRTYILNRLTGVLSTQILLNGVMQTLAQTYNCHAAQKQF
jgi:hypothetical protein